MPGHKYWQPSPQSFALLWQIATGVANTYGLVCVHQKAVVPQVVPRNLTQLWGGRGLEASPETN